MPEFSSSQRDVPPRFAPFYMPGRAMKATGFSAADIALFSIWGTGFLPNLPGVTILSRLSPAREHRRELNVSLAANSDKARYVLAQAGMVFTCKARECETIKAEIPAMKFRWEIQNEYMVPKQKVNMPEQRLKIKSYPALERVSVQSRGTAELILQ